jgi:hypothetical protein
VHSGIISSGEIWSPSAAASRPSTSSAGPGEALRVRVRDAEQVGDHRDRQRGSERRDQVELARRLGAVQQVADGALDPLCVTRHGLRAERRQREPAQPRVVGRVHAQEGEIELVPPGGFPDRPDAEAPVPQHHVADRVAHGRPVSQPRRDEHAAGAHPLIDPVRVDASRAQLQQHRRIATAVAHHRGVGSLAVETRGEGHRQAYPAHDATLADRPRSAAVTIRSLHDRSQLRLCRPAAIPA